ncbi:MAG: hypothetical protein M3R17_10495 [Bacteroidota bacterium]|nr:hypothetical protein [Bacteroidota bacterium]
MMNFVIFIFLPISIAVLIVGCTAIVAAVSRSYAGRSGKKILSSLESSDRLQTNLVVSNSGLTKEQIESLTEQASIIQNHKTLHKETFLTLYKFHFASVSLLLIFSVITSVLAFVIAQKGWANIASFIQASFLTCVALTSFYGLSPVVFKQDAGIKKNISSFIAFDNLQKEIYNYSRTNPCQTSNGEVLSFNAFFSQVTKRIKELNNIYLEFNHKGIEPHDYLKGI